MKDKYKKNKNVGSCFLKLYSASSKRHITKRYASVDGSPEYSKGYAILFTVVIVGIISMISVGLSNSAYKQTILSAVARDSTTAFYQADIGSECAMYVDSKFTDSDMNSPESGWTCGGKEVIFNDPVLENVDGIDQKRYLLKLKSIDDTSSKKCFRLEIIKKYPTDSIETEINSRGYNICNTRNLRTVERALKVTY